MKKRALKQVATWHNVDKARFEQEIQPLAEPAILKGLVDDWPLVNHAKASENSAAQAVIKQLSSLYIGGNVQFARLDKTSANGRYFYNPNFTGFNFSREIASFDAFISELLSHSTQSEQAVAIQSAPVADYFPKFEQDHSLDLFGAEVKPRFWLGNHSTVAPHYDDADNIACVVLGKRRFTLFPPEQISNLYVGPLNNTPAGAPVSMVDVANPDFAKFPKFKSALNQALVAELEPGDAIYIPTLWWHNVEALSNVNLLVNYWYGGSIAGTEKPVPMDTLLMSLLTLKNLPAQKRKAWQAFFNYYIFESPDDALDHIPAHIRGILADLSSSQKQQISQWLISQLSNKNNP
ncbi:cupin-like domain-containing protein [Thalassotalea sp. LPB0316]|uniref:cupin-like domain-containing protein n=1 Tax=Thalassotalea sp. LPB0316 TaxID=2769490 RepID=UPI001866D4AB|nr:cupin-like domain-containing protein [Thalassotalea sp. LPB0316]QOL25527.1 cupin-like domain-containing protein [Thalassotalea sp. LPB0316]